MSRLPPGLYEALVTSEIERDLLDLERRWTARRRPLPPGETPDRVALHLARVVRRVLESQGETQRVQVGLQLIRRLLEALHAEIEGADVLEDTVVETSPLLDAILRTNPDGSLAALARPSTPLLDTTVLINAPGEPRIGTQIRSELPSADRVDLVMAFIRMSGLKPLHELLRDHCVAGRPLRVLTTTYTGSTEQAALEQLRALGAQVRVSYDTSSTRLHAKAWIFHRDSGYSTAFIGSSNLTHSAQRDGMEWNVRASGARNPEVLGKVVAAFDSYWESDDFLEYDPVVFAEAQERSQSASGARILLSPLEIRPEPFQERLLEQIAVARARGQHQNLLVAATGTGKTVMAAVDYARLRNRLPRDRLLFVAHRKEILDQALGTFRQALRAPSFGELWTGHARPERFQHVFASIQSLQRADLDHLAPDHFDVVIIDEFHHAAAATYRRLLDHVRPLELLGLTATPERGDGQSVLEFFDGRIAAELRLWDAIDQGRLAPFSYFGVHDQTDLSEVTFRRGQGYDVEELTALLTGDHARARLVLSQLKEHVAGVDQIRTLGFCVSVRHAHFMAAEFARHGLSARAVSGQTPANERDQALRDLERGDLSVLFSVDLFNEGVDLPRVDTLLLLRPTDSPTLFLQQLGRGLRRSPGKVACTVLDFVGQHHRQYRMDRRFHAMLGGTRRQVQQAVEEGFPFLPAGCHMQLDPVARDLVLANLKSAIPSRWNEKVGELRTYVAAFPGKATLGHFLEETGLDLEDVYTGLKSWSDLQQDAGLPVADPGPEEVALRRACGRLLHVDDLDRLAAYRRLLQGGDPSPDDVLGQRRARMLASSLTYSVIEKTTPVAEALRLVRAHPQVCAELLDLFEVLEARIDHIQSPLPEILGPVPLQIHGRYTRAEILGAFGQGGDTAKIPRWQSGVYFARDVPADLFAFTLDKSGGHFSPTTMYRDYALSPNLIHWESQGACRAESEAGRRYQQHVAEGSSILLFAQRDRSTKAFWCLGPATYVRHQGERPMAIVWRLQTPLPGDLYAEFKAVAG